MLSLGHWLRPPRHVLALFLGVTGSLLLTMAWLAWQLMAQDRALAAQRTQERLENAADAAVASVRHVLEDISQQLDALSRFPPGAAPAEIAKQGAALGHDAALIHAGREVLDVWPAGRLLYYPSSALTRDAAVSAVEVFVAGERLEFQDRDLAGALRAFEPLAASADSLVRAGALLRTARLRSQLHQFDLAIRAYDRLALLGATPAEGLPAELVARYGRCLAFRALGRREDLDREAAALQAALDAGAWRLTRAEYAFYRAQARDWHLPGSGLLPAAELQAREGISAAVAATWDAWGGGPRSLAPPAGHRVVHVGGLAMLVVWRATGEGTAVLVGGPHYVDTRLVGPANDGLRRYRARMLLSDADAHASSPRGPADQVRQVQRAASETRLPWSLSIADTDPGAELVAASARGRFVVAGLIALILFVLGGSAFIVRAVNRELEVSRLQTDFVAAVSHEFRTPLTSIRQVNELLLEGRVPEARRVDYYRMQHRDSERLQRLVESLLDFGRMESGAYEYRFEPVDLTAFVRALAGEFSMEVAAAGYGIEVDLQSDGAVVSADREALGRAVWNLLDNAVKYSPAHKTVWLTTAVVDGRAEISVRDRGVGVPAGDEHRIFDKFARGANAAVSGTKGTGLGLTMVRHIATAHGGSVRLESVPGAGSTFTISLPRLRAGADER